MTQSANDIVGHKTFDTGEIGESGSPALRHEPLTRAEAEAIIEREDREVIQRAADMPDEQAAIDAMFRAWLRLKELGWREAMYCPKDGRSFKVIEPGSTGIFDCVYSGEWPAGSYWISDHQDSWPSNPVLFK